MVDDIIVTCVVCIVPVYEGRTYIYNPFCEDVKQHPCVAPWLDCPGGCQMVNR